MSKVFLAGLTATVLFLAIGGSFSTQSIAQQGKVKSQSTIEQALPIVRFTSQTSSGQHRMTNEENTPAIREMPNITVITEGESWIERLPGLPVEKSDAVVIGTVTYALAYLSNENTKVYSEYTIGIEEILKDKGEVSLVPGTVVNAIRDGGRVQFPSGHIQTYVLSGQGAVRTSQRYVLFLRKNTETNKFVLLTGYELRKGQVTAVDEVSAHSKYTGSEESRFINIVKAAIAERAEKQ